MASIYSEAGGQLGRCELHKSRRRAPAFWAPILARSVGDSRRGSSNTRGGYRGGLGLGTGKGVPHSCMRGRDYTRFAGACPPLTRSPHLVPPSRCLISSCARLAAQIAPTQRQADGGEAQPRQYFSTTRSRAAELPEPLRTRAAGYGRSAQPSQSSSNQMDFPQGLSTFPQNPHGVGEAFRGCGSPRR